MEFQKSLFLAGALHDGHPVLGEPRVIEIAQIQEQLQVDIDEARDVFGAFDVARHPVKAIGDRLNIGIL